MANLMALYNEAVQHSHAAGLSAVAMAVSEEVRAEVNTVRDEAEKLLTGVNVRDLLTENEQLKAKVEDLTQNGIKELTNAQATIADLTAQLETLKTEYSDLLAKEEQAWTQLADERLKLDHYINLKTAVPSAEPNQVTAGTAFGPATAEPNAVATPVTGTSTAS